MTDQRLKYLLKKQEEELQVKKITASAQADIEFLKFLLGRNPSYKFSYR